MDWDCSGDYWEMGAEEADNEDIFYVFLRNIFRRNTFYNMLVTALSNHLSPSPHPPHPKSLFSTQ